MPDEIIIQQFNGIGDALFLTPSLPLLKRQCPGVKITINTKWPELFKGNPYVDNIGNDYTGIKTWYPCPLYNTKHNIKPDRHHIHSVYRDICVKLDLIPYKLIFIEPKIYYEPVRPIKKTDIIGVQVHPKIHWHQKKVWPHYEALAEMPGFQAIPWQYRMTDLFDYLLSCHAVVTTEGGIQHICKALDIPCVVIYGGFADPSWNGYQCQVNITRTPECACCYNAGPCTNKIERKCMYDISIEEVMEKAKGL